MIPQIKRILYATDLSDNSAYVFRYAIKFAKEYDAGIIILHVLEQLSTTANAITHSHLTKEEVKKISEENSAHLKDHIKKQLKIFCEKKITPKSVYSSSNVGECVISKLMLPLLASNKSPFEDFTIGTI